MSLFRSILVPIDGSEQSHAASSLALRLAKEKQAALTFLNVIESEKIVASVIPGSRFTDLSSVIEELRANGAAILRDAVTEASAAGVPARSQLAEGDCVEMIVEVARSSGADLVVMGGHGRSGLDRLLLGSVAEGVVRKSPKPVLVAKSQPN